MASLEKCHNCFLFIWQLFYTSGMPDHLPAISLQEDSHTGTHSNLYIISLIKQDVDRNKRKMFGYVPLNINHQIPDTKTLQMSRMWKIFVWRPTWKQLLMAVSHVDMNLVWISEVKKIDDSKFIRYFQYNQKTNVYFFVRKG